ncbi:MAG TPA: peptidoglycan DD-metalloendopeptidase family protein [Acidimicrobiia bacterium]|nr:peptidoglycan DD-metalloendopeptidase family protein [Acidimicrobiia bacterium]
MSRRFLLCFFAGVLLLGLVAPGLAGAQTSPDPRARRDQLANAIEDVSAEEAAAITQLQGIITQRQDLEAKVAALDAQIAEATQRVEAADAEVARIQAQIETVQRDIDRIQAEIEASKAKFNESVLALYKGGGNGSNNFTLLSSGGGAHELIAGSKYLGENSRQFDRELQRQGSLKDQLDDAQNDLRKEQAKAQEAQQVATQERDRVGQLRTEADGQRDQVAAAEQQEQQAVAGIQARKADFEAQYQAVQAQIAASVSRGNPTPGNHRFIWPVDGPITSGFGPRVQPIIGASTFHPGVDIAASQGTPIKAAGDGVVKMAGPNGGYGNFTLIDHGGGLATGYGHQSRIAVSVGQHVSTGQVIGYVGSTGTSTGPHLHWEVRVNGNPVNPLGWV